MTVDFLDENEESTSVCIALQVHCVCMCGVIAVNHDDIASLVNSQVQLHCKKAARMLEPSSPGLISVCA